jgi:hypothetical protein
MTAVEIYELATKGGASDLALLIATCETLGPYCLIGGLAVNCYVEPVYTVDADLVISSANLLTLSESLPAHGFKVEEHPDSLYALRAGSELRIQFTTDQRYQNFLGRSIDAQVLGVSTKVACLADVVQGKLWAYGDPKLRLSKRKKDELDLIRLAEAYPDIRERLPKELLDQIKRG